MKKVLLTLAAFAAFSAVNAQQTYNYFDPADCDADGWLWFDTQDKLDKYCGWDSSFKIQLLTTTYEDSEGLYPEPELNGTMPGYDKEGVAGTAGTKTGAIVIPRATTYGAKNGGGFMMWLPDLAEFSVFMSCEGSLYQPCLQGGEGWIERVDFQTVKGYARPFTKLTSDCQYQWNNLQNFENANSGFKLLSPAGTKVTAALMDDQTSDILIQGIKVFTYTKTSYPEGGSGVGEINVDDANAPVEFFNMQGMKVSGNEPGMYIRRQGSKTAKVIVK